MINSHRIIFNNWITIQAAKNESVCLTYYGCNNYNVSGNYTINFTSSTTGYLYITSSNPAYLNIVEGENYSPPIPQSFHNQYASVVPNTIINDVYVGAFLNQTFNQISIPILPGKITIKIYNPNNESYYGKLKIIQVN